MTNHTPFSSLDYLHPTMGRVTIHSDPICPPGVVKYYPKDVYEALREKIDAFDREMQSNPVVYTHLARDNAEGAD